MKKIAKLILVLILITLSVLAFVFVLNMEGNLNKVYAASGSSSDLQLMARAINGEARGESYEGQVAVRCGYFKSCERFQISEYHCGCYL